jgi:hypothetical protein
VLGVERRLSELDVRAEDRPEGRDLAFVRHPDGARVDPAHPVYPPIHLHVCVARDDHTLGDALEQHLEARVRSAWRDDVEVVPRARVAEERLPKAVDLERQRLGELQQETLIVL